MKRQPASRSERSHRSQGHSPESILPTLNRLATPEGLPKLLELAVSGRADTALRICRGPTWTNIAQRALHLSYAVLSDLGPATPVELLQRIKEMRAVGVNWVYGIDDSPAGHALFNYGTFDFDTTELRRAADQILEQQSAASPSRHPPSGATKQSARPMKALQQGLDGKMFR